MKKVLMSIITLVLTMNLATCGSNHAEKAIQNEWKEQVSQGTPSNDDKQQEQKAGTSYSKNIRN